MLPIEAIFFDLDDTLLNTAKAQENAICEFKNFYNEFKNVNNLEFVKKWDEITEETYDRYLNDEFTFEQMRIERMKKIFSNYGIIIADEDAKERFETYLKIYKKNWILFEDAKQLLDSLNGKYKLGIISNGDSAQQREKIEFTGLNKYFSNVVISSEVGYSKPEKEIFEIACKNFNLDFENCIMIGDKYKVDVDGSKKAGMRAIWANRKKENINYKYQINKLMEIPKQIQSIEQDE